MGEKNSVGRERRYYVRLDADIEVRFRIEGYSPDRVFKAKTRDISFGGICLKVTEGKEELQEALESRKPVLMLQLDLVLPDETIKAEAEAKWISTKLDWLRKPREKDKPVLVGLSFEKMEEKSWAALKSHIAERFRKERAENFPDKYYPA